MSEEAELKVTVPQEPCDSPPDDLADAYERGKVLWSWLEYYVHWCYRYASRI